MNVSGLLEACLITSVSLKRVMAGKHNTRALHCHNRVAVESFIRLLMSKFLEEKADAEVFGGRPGMTPFKDTEVMTQASRRPITFIFA